MNRIAKVWEDLDKKRGRHANLSSNKSKAKKVNLAKISDFDEFEAEEDRINDDLMRLADDTSDIDNLVDTILGNAETIMNLNEENMINVEETYAQLKEQFEELGMDIEDHAVGKLYEERKMGAEYTDEEVNKMIYQTLERFADRVQKIIGSKK